ncbi:uncharacterized protein K489DRAFT_293706, partial [Dissoconium aciculare CBS 342.82]|uniref:Azaphilone pigments biosynthesis cluster protein L N-terminal domain-containing protein n=1 Tax=Dissoconium aciculare CBS 342.82 TaxID=1314786 RepID=A0A6J3LPC9_9PEZI
MADPLSIAASLLAISTAAIQSAKSLREAVKRYKGRDKTLGRLQDELDHLSKILESLTQTVATEESLLALLQGPIERCDQVCREFEAAMEGFSQKSKTGFRDWARMEFMRGDINEFIETIAGYKSTISVGLGTVTMQSSKISEGVLLKYTGMIKDTTYNLELHLQRIDDKITQPTTDRNAHAEIGIDLRDEREATKQCLQICEDLRSYFQNLSLGASSCLQDPPENVYEYQSFEAQTRMRQTIDEAQESFVQKSDHLSKRLASLLRGQASDSDRVKPIQDLKI